MEKRGETITKRTPIQYVVCEGKGSLYQKVRIPSDVNISHIDEEYYIDNQIIPATISLLEVFGYTIEDLKGKNVQQGLGGFME